MGTQVRMLVAAISPPAKVGAERLPYWYCSSVLDQSAPAAQVDPINSARRRMQRNRGFLRLTK